MDGGSQEQRSDGFTAVEDRFDGYNVYDPNNERIGKVDDLFVDASDQPEYVGVKMGFLGMSSTLLPWDLVTRVDDENGRVEVSADKDTAKNGPTFSDDHEITPEYENEVYSYYGLTRSSTGDTGSYGGYYGEESQTTAGTTGNVGPGITEGDTESGEFRGHAEDDEGVRQSRGSDLDDRDELRVQRSEEELRAGTREREAGAVNVRKRVRTDRERLEVPVKREEVSVERVPVNEEATGAEIGEDEVVVPVTEEEVIVDKRAVVKEEVRVRKDVVQDTEIVEEDVRREEVDVEDASTTRRPDTGV